MNVNLIGFGCPQYKFERTNDRFYNEAKNLNFFKTIKVFSDDAFSYCFDLKEHENYCRSTEKIFGNGLWKWFLISKFMDEIPKDEIIFYVDVGCSFNETAIDRLYYYCDIVNKKNNLSFSLPYPEVRFTKMDTYMRVFPNSNEHLYTDQILSGIMAFKNTFKNKEIIEELKIISVEKNYHYINDYPSITQNDTIFESHRHDQSIFSLINKKYNFFSLPDETYWYPNWNVTGKNYPIWAIRTRN